MTADFFSSFFFERPIFEKRSAKEFKTSLAGISEMSRIESECRFQEDVTATSLFYLYMSFMFLKCLNNKIR